MNKLSIVIPAYNEEEGIVETLKQLISSFPDSEIIVVDDGSTDSTVEYVTNFETVNLIKHEFNRGYGSAIKTGMQSATRDYIAWFDADNEHNAENLKNMVEILESKKLVAVLGQRDRSINKIRGFGKFIIRLLAWSLDVKTGVDLNCGLRVFRREIILRYLYLLPDKYSASMTSTIIMIERKYPFIFHPITINQRLGESKVALSDGFEALILVLRAITLFSPIRVFLRLSILLLSVGIVYGLIKALITGLGFSVLSAILIMAGLIIGVLGLIADQISQMRLTNLDIEHRKKRKD
ncbi:MAG: hypothetical protein CMF44_05625 [Legionellales bacterium]|jgi:glycosyltransferase involved in cell wall biosynthesis|nr:hypothetical protein [Legionellales bacterium]|tara:strand:- start:1348 stop:2229 length:882 start_codon:yes stop_codon:yes gene_type:complete